MYRTITVGPIGVLGLCKFNWYGNGTKSFSHFTFFDGSGVIFVDLTSIHYKMMYLWAHFVGRLLSLEQLSERCSSLHLTQFDSCEQYLSCWARKTDTDGIEVDQYEIVWFFNHGRSNSTIVFKILELFLFVSRSTKKKKKRQRQIILFKVFYMSS